MQKILYAGCILLLVSQKNFAQEIVLDPVTVTSSLVEKRSSETGRNITIITGESISKLPVHSIDELLKYVPGIEVQARGPQGSQSDISLRGGTFQQVLVILDGLRLNDANTGHFSAYIPITPSQIDRIEILKGASSAIYGSDAVGGVINIITKAFNASHQNNNMINAQLAAGEYGYASANVGGAFQKNTLTIDGGVLSNHSNGVLQRGTRGYFHNTSASLGLNYQFNPYWNLSLRSAYDNRDFAAQNFYTTYISDTASETVQSWWHQARLSYEKNKSNISLDAGYKNLNDEYVYNPHAIANNNNSKLLQSLLTYRYTFTPQTILISGFNFQEKKIKSNDRGNHSLNMYAPFISLVQNIGNYVTLQPSVRIEFIENLPAEFVPQFTFSYKQNNVQLRASGGKTIRSADFTELYNNFNKPLVTGGSIGNPNLNPERSWNYEAGIDWFYHAAFKLSATFFQRFYTDLIDYVTTPYADMPRKDNLAPNGTFALAKNIATVNTTGVETDVQYIKKMASDENLSINGGLIWMNSHSSESATSFYVNSHAKFLTNFSVIYTLKNLGISINGIYKNRKPQNASAINAYISKDYFLMNGKVSYNFIKNKFGLFAQVDNIFDRKYSDLLGASMPGRWTQAGIIFNFIN